MATAYIYRGEVDNLSDTITPATGLTPTAIANAWSNEVAVVFASAISSDEKNALDSFLTSRRLTYVRTETADAAGTSFKPQRWYDGTSVQQYLSGGNDGTSNEPPLACDSGVAVGDAVYMDSGTSSLKKAKADAIATTPCLGFVVAKPSSTTAVLRTTGRIDGMTDVSSNPLVLGIPYYLSPATAGKITATKPVVNNQIIQLVGHATDSDSLIIVPSTLRPTVSSVASSTPHSITSATYTRINSMILSPLAGSYMLAFNGSVELTGPGTVVAYVALFVNGAAVQERQLSVSKSLIGGETLMQFVTVGAGQSVEAKFKVAGGDTITVNERNMMLLGV